MIFELKIVWKRWKIGTRNSSRDEKIDLNFWKKWKIRNVVSNCYSVEWPCVLQRSSAGTLWDRRTGPSAPWGGYRPTRIPRRLIGRCVVEWKAFCPEKKKTRNFRGIHFNEKRIWFFERPIDTSRNEWNWNKWCPWNTRWFILVEWTSGAVGTELATLMADVCFYLKFPSIWWVRVGSYSAV